MVPSWANQLLPQLLMEQFDTLPIQCRHMDICMKEFGSGAFVYALMVPSWADQLLPQFLKEQFDTLPIQCRNIEHMHEGVWFRKK